MNRKNIIVGLLITASLVLGVLGVSNDSAPTERVVERVIEKQLGALAGPEIPYNYLKWGNVETYRTGVAMVSGTSTPCRAQGPSATSSVTASISITTSTTTALTWALSTSTSAQGYATTSPFYTFDLTANSQFDKIVVPTNTQSNSIPPNGWVTWSGYGTGSGGTANAGIIAGGKCNFEFQVLSR
jgi:hypothetical protein